MARNVALSNPRSSKSARAASRMRARLRRPRASRPSSARRRGGADEGRRDPEEDPDRPTRPPTLVSPVDAIAKKLRIRAGPFATPPTRDPLKIRTPQTSAVRGNRYVVRLPESPRVLCDPVRGRNGWRTGFVRAKMICKRRIQKRSRKCNPRDPCGPRGSRAEVPLSNPSFRGDLRGPPSTHECPPW